MSDTDLAPLWLTLRLAATTTPLLLAVRPPQRRAFAARRGGGVAAGAAADGAGILPAGSARPARRPRRRLGTAGSDAAGLQLLRSGGRLGAVFAALRRPAAARRLRKRRQP